MIYTMSYLLCSFLFIISSVHTKPEVAITEQNCEGINFLISLYFIFDLLISLFFSQFVSNSSGGLLILSREMKRTMLHWLKFASNNSVKIWKGRTKDLYDLCFCKFKFITKVMFSLLYLFVVLLCWWTWDFCHIYRKRNDKTSQLGNARWEGLREIAKKGLTDLRLEIWYVLVFTY